jgi:hypothetical protein
LGDAFIGVPFEGILGLGSAKLSVAESSPIFDNMKNLNLIEKQIFAVYLANVKSHFLSKNFNYFYLKS